VKRVSTFSCSKGYSQEMVVEFHLCEYFVWMILLILIMLGINLLMHDKKKKARYFWGFKSSIKNEHTFNKKKHALLLGFKC
jgi:hypothetical protein